MACTEWKCKCGEYFFSNSKVCPKCGSLDVELMGWDEQFLQDDEDFECEVEDD